MSFPVPASSRHRSGVATIFDVFCEIGVPDEDGNSLILTKYPEDYDDQTSLRSARQFSFPCGSLNLTNTQHFNFVLTNTVGEFTFGYCRYTPESSTCLCLLSGFSWYSGFHKMLNFIFDAMNNGDQEYLDLLLAKIYHTDIPEIGTMLKFHIGEESLEIYIPDPFRLPTARDDKFMKEFVQAVNEEQMIAIYASLLKERRIIFTSSRLAQLSSCVSAAAALIYPMVWQSIFIPVLPKQMIDMVMAPVPFLIGVPKQILNKMQLPNLGDVVIVDLEEAMFESSHDDVAALPEEVFVYLTKNVNKSNEGNIAHAFLHATALIFGGYRRGFVWNKPLGIFTWDRERCIAKHKPPYQQFLSTLVTVDGVQYLEKFIEDRIRCANTGRWKEDKFEKEILAIERSRPQMKEAIEAFKDKMSGIQQLARRSKSWTLRQLKSDDELMSFGNVLADIDNAERKWPNGDQSAESEHPTDPSQPKVEVITNNLIDLDSPSYNVPAVSFPFRGIQS